MILSSIFIFYRREWFAAIAACLLDIARLGYAVWIAPPIIVSIFVVGSWQWGGEASLGLGVLAIAILVGVFLAWGLLRMVRDTGVLLSTAYGSMKAKRRDREQS